MSLLFNLRALKAVNRIKKSPNKWGIFISISFQKQALLCRCIRIERTDVTVWF